MVCPRKRLPINLKTAVKDRNNTRDTACVRVYAVQDNIVARQRADLRVEAPWFGVFDAVVNGTAMVLLAWNLYRARQELAAAWSACGDDSDGDACAIRVRRFDANLAPLGPSTIANSTTAGSQQEPSIAIMPDGSLLTAWSDGSSAPPDRDGFGVRARIVYP